MDILYNFKINIAHFVQKVVHFCGKWYTLVKKTINFYGPIYFFGNRKLSPKSYEWKNQKTKYDTNTDCWLSWIQISISPPNFNNACFLGGKLIIDMICINNEFYSKHGRVNLILYHAHTAKLLQEGDPQKSKWNVDFHELWG